MSPRAWVSAFALVLIFYSAVLLAWVAVAKADDLHNVHNVAPMTNVYGDALIRQAVKEAGRQWDTLGLCTAVDLVVYDGDERIHPAGAFVGSCQIMFNRAYRNSMWSVVNDPHAPLGARRDELAALCGVADHEYGHAVVGLGHMPGTIMDGDKLTITQSCYDWADAKIAPLRKRTHRGTRNVHRH